MLELQKIFSGEVARRRILICPAEPPPEYLAANPADSIYLGRSDLLRVPVFWDFKRLANPHMAIVGMTGSGKSFFIKSFLTKASLVWQSNALILDWSGEYAPWVRGAGGTVVRLGQGGAINLLDLGGMQEDARARQVVSALEVLTDLSNYPRQRRITLDAIEKAYSAQRRADSTPTLYDVGKILAKWHSANPKSEDLEGALHRIGQFLKKGRDYFAKPSTVSLSKITSSGLVCLDLSSLPSEADRSLAALTMLQFIRERMRADGFDGKKGLKLIVVADEAWKIAQDERSDLVAIIREGRKYSFGIIVASQNPADLSKTILSNAATVLVFRLQLPESKDYVRQSLHYGQNIADKLEKFAVGQAAMHMAFSHAQQSFGTFIISKVDGDEPQMALRLRGDGMDFEISRDELRRRLLGLGCTDSQAAAVSSLFEANGNSLSALELALSLSKLGFGKPAIHSFLRRAGLPDSEAAGVFAKMQMQSQGAAGMNMAELVLEDG